MKKHIINRILPLVLFAFMAVALNAQTLRTGYFLKGNLYRYRINPALMNDQNYLSFPVLGNMDINTAGNVGLANFVYDSPNGTDLVTFMHPSVNADDFLGDLESDNQIMADLDLTIMSAGFFAFGGYNTIDLSARSRTGLNIPYDMFKFMKVMGSNDYSFGDLNARTRNYIDLSLGHSRKITEDLTVGARVKLLFGIAYADMTMDRMDISMNGDRWSINAKGAASVGLGGNFTLAEDGTVDGYDNVSVGMNGFGFGFDLGATYDLSNLVTKGLIVSASLNDIGSISWKNVAKAGISPDEPYVFDGFEEIAMDDDVPGRNLEDQFDDMKEDVEDFFKFEDMGEGSKSESLGATLNLGVEYKMPFYDKLSAGILYTNRFDDLYSYSQLSLMVNVSPLKSLDFALSGTTSTFGAGFGALANVRLKGFNFFVGTDCFISKVGKQFIPLENMNANVSFGINIPFGQRR